MEKFVDKIKNLFFKSYFYTFIVLNRKVLLCHMIMILLFLFFKIFKFFDMTTFLSVFIPALVSLVITLNDSKEYSTNLKIMSICYDYMEHGEGVSTDDILGLLISYKYRQKLKHPIYNFFDILKIKCQNGSVEEKRRVSEAIPMLYHIDKSGTKKLIEILRNDYDEEYYDDNRRRTIESFRYYSRFDSSFVKKMLTIREGDSVYTVIAIIEIIIFTTFIREKDKELELSRLKSSFEVNKFNEAQKKFFDDAIDFFNSIKSINSVGEIESHFKKYMEIFNESELYMRILISKNIITICPFHNQCRKKNKCLNNTTKKAILDFFDLCFSSERNVRRPMAKEDVCYCLLRMINFPEFSNEARKRIIRLIKDSDQIIPITTFDYIYDIYDTDTKLYKEIMNYCLNLTDDHPLKNRALHVIKNIEIMPK